jgi:hypothetical protein
MLSSASATILTAMKLATSNDDSFCIFPSTRAGRARIAFLLLPLVKEQ